MVMIHGYVLDGTYKIPQELVYRAASKHRPKSSHLRSMMFIKALLYYIDGLKDELVPRACTTIHMWKLAQHVIPESEIAEFEEAQSEPPASCAEMREQFDAVKTLLSLGHEPSKCDSINSTVIRLNALDFGHRVTAMFDFCCSLYILGMHINQLEPTCAANLTMMALLSDLNDISCAFIRRLFFWCLAAGVIAKDRPLELLQVLTLFNNDNHINVSDPLWNTNIINKELSYMAGLSGATKVLALLAGLNPLDADWLWNQLNETDRQLFNILKGAHHEKIKKKRREEPCARINLHVDFPLCTWIDLDTRAACFGSIHSVNALPLHLMHCLGGNSIAIPQHKMPSLDEFANAVVEQNEEFFDTAKQLGLLAKWAPV